MTGARHKRTHVIWFLSYEISRVGNSYRQTADWWLPGTEERGKWGVITSSVLDFHLG